MANTYRITVTNPYASQRAGARGILATADVRATTPAVAVKRLLDGGHAAGYQFATVGPKRLVELAPGQAVNIRVERLKGGR